MKINSLTVAAVAVMFLFAAVASGQTPAGSSARAIPTEVEKAEVRVSQIITRAEDHFQKGKLNLDDNKRDAHRNSRFLSWYANTGGQDRLLGQKWHLPHKSTPKGTYEAKLVSI